MTAHDIKGSPFWRSLAGFGALGFGAVAAFFLFTEHRAHAYGVLPFLLLLACPVMMLSMHHGHAHTEHQDHVSGNSVPPNPSQETHT